MTITIHWEDSFPQKEIIKSVDPKRGIYQFYGYHPVYGKDKDALLYIEKADDMRDSLLHHDFLGDLVPTILKPPSVSIRVAYISDPGVDLDAVEKLLIFMHSPAWNDDGIKKVCRKYQPLKIHNTGDLGDLWVVVEGWKMFV